jgi:beta-glucosidase
MTRMQELCRTAGTEGAVLLKNENHALPVKQGEVVSIFGRIQLNYYKSGTGSGGLVNVDYVVDIPDGLRAAEGISINEELYRTYQEWEISHPFDKGKGWAQEPFCQEEMELSDELVKKAAENSDLALVIIGRLAGEDRDGEAVKGSYYLSDGEEAMLRTVRAHFDRVAVLLNVGNLQDMSWDHLCDAVMYVWQGGQEGGNAVADVLTGKVTPSGKLSDTIAVSLDDVPVMKNFGDPDRNIYEEDVYVGYRWFETFAPEKVKYPFGFGLSYTTFSWEQVEAKEYEDSFSVTVSVENTGSVSGKEVIQVYAGIPQGKLGQPSKVLCGFAKTNVLDPGMKQQMTIVVPKKILATYDDSGITGHRSCRVLEEGEYKVFVGTNVRDSKETFRFVLDKLQVVETLTESMSPTTSFQRVHPKIEDGKLVPAMENVPQRTYNLMERISANRPKDLPFKGDLGIKLKDVKDGKNTMAEFLTQLTDEDLACIVRGEGMCSPKVTLGTAGAFGGLTVHLRELGIPAGCCADGPSGIRMDCGTRATSIPSGTLLACTFNEELNEALFEEMGAEVYKNRIDTLLGPGINIHRSPLNGRNFEYFSEDPFLTGKMAAAQLRGMHKHGVTGTIKHFCANNQEYRRTFASSDLSERALRDIYLRGFEMAVKEGNAHSIMTSYNPINGIWAAGNYDLCTTILRGDWGYTGVVMTDWWAKMNDEGEEGDVKNTKAMVRAQNDLFMVTVDALQNTQDDNTMESLKAGTLTRGELQRSAANICRFLMNSPCIEERQSNGVNGNWEEERPNEEKLDFVIHDDTVLDVRGIDSTRGTNTIYTVLTIREGTYELTVTASSEAGGVAQIPVTISMRHHTATFSFVGTGGKTVEKTAKISLDQGKEYLKIYFGQSGLDLQKLHFRKISDQKED